MTTDITNSAFLQEYVICAYQNYTLYPLILLMIVVLMYFPYILLSFFFSSSLIFSFIYKKIYNLQEDIAHEKWNRLAYWYSVFLNIFGKLVHGYEICGTENLPEGPGLVVYYHGSTPIDYMCFVSRLNITRTRCFSVIDRLFYILPVGVKLMKKIWNLCETREECVETLKKGYLVGIAPGGLREQNYGDNTYRLIWGKRKGFAQVAIDAKVPVIPVFTQNIREANRTYGNIWPMRWLYERARFIIFPAFGPIPVKLRTHIGEPIPYDPNTTADELVVKVKTAIEALRDKHQKIPGSIRTALWERFETHHKAK
ncbi:DGAT1/2-independent enzyme synthesizing storage lipids-like isoform X2 [Paroedura picta]